MSWPPGCPDRRPHSGSFQCRTTLNQKTRRAYDTLWTRRRIAIAMTPSGDSEGLRFCPHIYNSIEELDRAVEAVRALAG